MKVRLNKLPWREFLKRPFVTVDIDNSDWGTTRVNVGMRIDFAIVALLAVAVLLFFAFAR